MTEPQEWKVDNHITNFGQAHNIAVNEDTVTVLDVTDIDDVQMLARSPYEASAYTHQGWFTEDHRYFLLGDELDELDGTVTGTTTYVWDLTDLDNPVLNGMYNNGNASIDHNASSSRTAWPTRATTPLGCGSPTRGRPTRAG